MSSGAKRIPRRSSAVFVFVSLAIVAHYGAFYCSQATFPFGGDYWHRFFSRLSNVLTEAQHPNGSWDSERPDDGEFGNNYTTALAVLTLATPYQLLPIYQR